MGQTSRQVIALGLVALSLSALAPPAGGQAAVPPQFIIEEFAVPSPNLILGAGLVVLPDDRVLITDRWTGMVRMFRDDSMNAVPVIDFPTNRCGDRGLVGIDVDPDFENNGWVYVFVPLASTPTESGVSWDLVDYRIARFTLSADTALGTTSPRHRHQRPHVR